MPNDQDFSDDWKAFNDAAKSNSENYDKGILTVATIALSLGVALSKDLGAISTGMKVLLGGSWILLGLSVGSVLYGYRLTADQIGLLRVRNSHKNGRSQVGLTKMQESRLSNLNASISLLNTASGVFLTLGLVLSILYALLSVI